MADRDLDEVTDRLQNAVAEAVGELVTGWTFIVDTITDEGYPATWWLTAPNQPNPTTLGHTTHVDHAIQARMILDRMEPPS